MGDYLALKWGLEIISPDHRIPSVVFIEIFDKWILDDESRSEFYAEVFIPTIQSPNIEIKPIDEEVLEKFLLLNDETINLENHDKIILASAMMLECPLITSDERINEYVDKYKVIPSTIQ